MRSEEPTCSQCGYPIRTSEHAPACPSRKETEKSSEGKLRETVLEFGRIVETQDVGELVSLLDHAEQEWMTLESRDGKEEVEASLEEKIGRAQIRKAENIFCGTCERSERWWG